MAGEAEIARKEEIYEPQSFSVDDIDVETEDGREITEPDSKTTEDEFEVEVEGEDKGIETETKESDSLRREIADLKDQIIKLSTRREEPKKEPPSDKPEKLTRGQIAKILTEHKDDPEVLLNVIEYLSEQKALEIKDSTVKDMNHQQWSSQLSGVANRVLSDDEDGYLAANPTVTAGLEDMAGNLGLSNHPIGKLAAYAIYRLTNAAKAKSKEGDKPKSDKETPSKRVFDKTRTSDKGGKGYGLTQVQLETARKFGVKPETYAKFVRRS
jgi:hypothetical protein